MLDFTKDEETIESDNINNSDASDELETGNQNEILFDDNQGFKSRTKKVVLEEYTKNNKSAYYFRSTLMLKQIFFNWFYWLL